MFYDDIQESAAYISARLKQRPNVAVILGSGLGAVVEAMQDKIVIQYQDIPHFPCSTVAGHAGNLVVGSIGGVTVAALQGRVHYYEGLGMKAVSYPVYVLKLLGIRSLIVTNACGGINRSFHPGDLMLITDFINLLSDNPLIGANDERLGVRFPDMSEPYSTRLLEKAKQVARRSGISYREGVYALFNGPCYETAAEIRAYAAFGADAVGMSTVPETIAANYLGMEVLGICCITNMATGIARQKHSHDEVIRMANESSKQLARWITELMQSWNTADI